MHSTKTLWALGGIVLVCVIAVVLLAPSIMQQSATTTQQATSTPAQATTTTKQVTTVTHHYTAPTKTTTTKPAASAASSSTATVSGVGPLSYLIQLKQPLVCSVKSSSSYTKRSGTVYVAQGKLHADFSSYINGTLTHTFMIDDGLHLYAWQSGAAKGLELLAASSVSGSAIANAGGMDLATSVYYACNPWTEDPSIFVAPSSVTFSNSL